MVSRSSNGQLGTSRRLTNNSAVPPLTKPVMTSQRRLLSDQSRSDTSRSAVSGGLMTVHANSHPAVRSQPFSRSHHTTTMASRINAVTCPTNTDTSERQKNGTSMI